MSTIELRRIALITFSLGLVLLALIIAAPKPAFSDEGNSKKPYFKAFGADVFTGGWFNNLGACPSQKGSSYYQDPLDGGNDLTGGIMAFANSGGPNPGAASEFGALSLGLIQGNTGDKYGFYSGEDKNSLSFSNDNGIGHLGGLWQGETRQSHCIPDYYGIKKPANLPPDKYFEFRNELPNGIYFHSDNDHSKPFDITYTEIKFVGGKLITVFVDGDTYIDQNITYDFPNYTPATVPKFALVVKGNIYIGKDVTRLDGLYIAQPDMTNQDPVKGDTGIFWTCHPNAPGGVSGQYLKDNCDQKLLINGALIAKQVNLVRTNGDINTANIAEVINFSPEMIIGGPFFTGAESSLPKVESLTSLPPIF